MKLLSLHRLLGAALLLSFAVSAPAAAQFGGLKKKIQKAAGVDNAQAQATDEAAARTGAVAPAPAFDNVTLEMTPQRLDQVLAAAPKMEAMYAQMTRPVSDAERQRREAALDAQREKNRRWEHCRDSARADWGEKVGVRLQRMAAAGDEKGLEALNDTLGRMSDLQFAAAADSAHFRKACGAPPASAPGSTDITTTDMQNELRRLTSLSPMQWAALKERLIAAMALPKRHFEGGDGGGDASGAGDGGGSGPRASGLSPLETGAIRDRWDALKGLVRSEWVSAI